MNPGYTRSMRAVMLEVPEELLEDRRRRGLDKSDEVWDGVLHMVPPPAPRHNFLVSDLNAFLRRVAARRGLMPPVSETGVFDPTKGLSNYRVPDLVIAAEGAYSERGVEGAATLVVEVLSPHDESRDKLPFYACVDAREIWIVDPKTRAIEVFESRDGEPVSVPSADGRILSPLGIELSVILGPKLRLVDGADTAEI